MARRRKRSRMAARMTDIAACTPKACTRDYEHVERLSTMAAAEDKRPSDSARSAAGCNGQAAQLSGCRARSQDRQVEGAAPCGATPIAAGPRAAPAACRLKTDRATIAEPAIRRRKRRVSAGILQRDPAGRNRPGNRPTARIEAAGMPGAPCWPTS
jgi:hypothetical protein